jgi:hypothetical protein
MSRVNKTTLASEVVQMFLAACNFVRMAKDSYARLDAKYLNMRTDTLGSKFNSETFTAEDECVLFTLSYLSSAAIRISTIYEAVGLKPKARDLYKTKITSKNKIDYLCHYLRDNVCHEEPAPGEEYEIRQKYLSSLTVKEIFENTVRQVGISFDEVRKMSVYCSNIINNKRVAERIKEVVG